MERYFGEKTPKLGFGLMRLPKLEDGKTIDVEQTKQMVDMFLAAGQTYFDTAYVYDRGESEKATKLALVDRHPRDSYTICTKLNAGVANSEEEAKSQLYTSLERTGAGYFDYYLLHALQSNNIDKYEDYHLWDFANEQKAKGVLKHIGFSYHDGPELLDKLLTKHPEVDFIQLQINYRDWENKSIASRANYEVARKYGVSLTVMEPVKGGQLANPPKEVQDVFKAIHPDMSCASWAIRYVASLDGIITVLSGMSNVEQMADNLSYMEHFKSLDDEEKQAIRKAQEILGSVNSIPCTACHYCTDGCPMGIPIPDIFAARNKQLIWGQIEESRRDYALVIEDSGKAGDCIGCGQCENACPQHIKIISKLAECSEVFAE